MFDKMFGPKLISSAVAAGGYLLVAGGYLLVAGVFLATLASCPAEALAANQSETNQLKAAVTAIEPCMIDAVFSSLFERSYLPTTIEALATSCKRQSDAFKCIKDRSKGTPIIIRRGLAALVSNRQRANKKFCTNLNSDASRKTVQDFKCIVEKRFALLKANDVEYANSLNEIGRLNLNDSALELKYFCCTTYKFRRVTIDTVGQECESAKQTYQEVINSIIPSEINLICEDEDKLTPKVCAELPPLRVGTSFDPHKSQSPAVAGLYLVATLGEAD